MSFILTEREKEILSLLNGQPKLKLDLPKDKETLYSCSTARTVAVRALDKMDEEELHNLGISRGSLERVRAKTYGLNHSILSEESYRMLEGRPSPAR